MSDLHIQPLQSKNDDTPITVLLVTDNLTFSAGLKMLLESKLALNVVETRRANSKVSVSSKKPDIIVLAVERLTDLDLISDLLKASSTSRILTFISEANNYLMRVAMQHGAAGIVTSGDDPAMVYAAIEALYSHKTFISPLVSHLLFYEKRNPETETLTSREYEVVACVCQGLVNKEIAVRLHMSEPTVKHHIRTIFEKLYLSNRAELVAYAFSNGIVEPQFNNRFMRDYPRRRW